MDPDACLADLLDLAHRVADRSDTADAACFVDADADDLARGLLDLDEWLRSRGFLPTAWRR